MNCCNKPTCPCKYEPIILPVREVCCNKYYPVEQPIICPVNTRVVHHFVPKPVYYHTQTQTEETVCEGQTGMNPTYAQPASPYPNGYSIPR